MILPSLRYAKKRRLTNKNKPKVNLWTPEVKGLKKRNFDTISTQKLRTKKVCLRSVSYK